MKKLTYYKLDLNAGKYEEEVYSHYHISNGHGDPHIWFYPGIK